MLAGTVPRGVRVLRTLVDKLTVRGALEAEELLLMIRPATAAAGGAGGARPARPGTAVPQPAIRRPAAGDAAHSFAVSGAFPLSNGGNRAAGWVSAQRS